MCYCIFAEKHAIFICNTNRYIAIFQGAHTYAYIILKN